MKLTASSRDTAIGRITLLCSEDAICALQLPCRAEAAPPPAPGSIVEEAFDQIEEYLAGKRQSFQLPLHLPESTGFAGKILRAIAAIPYGATATYSSLGPARAVGQICAGNPLPLLIPCHRVVPASHPPGNYLGGKELKANLLDIEHRVSGAGTNFFLAMPCPVC